MTATRNASVERARELLHVAADASKKLEESVRELVTMRAWTVLGYENFSQMWEEENGFKIPKHVQVLAAIQFRSEGMAGSGRVGEKYGSGRRGYTQVEVAKQVGFTVETVGGKERSNTVAAVFTQADHGVPVDKINKGSLQQAKRQISLHGNRPWEPRARAQPRRMGATPDDLVSESFNISKRDADAIHEIARDADVPKAQIYRQAVAEYLARHRASRPVAFSGEAK